MQFIRDHKSTYKYIYTVNACVTMNMRKKTHTHIHKHNQEITNKTSDGNMAIVRKLGRKQTVHSACASARIVGVPLGAVAKRLHHHKLC